MSAFSSTIDNVTINMHNIDTDNLPDCLYETSERFGILKIKTNKVEITKKPVFILFTIDRTGSMSDHSGNGGTKIGHLKQTFNNMISYFSKIEGADVYIRVHSFNDKVDYTIDTVKVTPDNVDILTKCIQDITADGLTAIDNALLEANTAMKNYSMENPTHSCVHIFMTDGEPSLGISDSGALSEIVDDSFANIFVGFGNGHNARLLRKFSEKKLAEYQYVDSAENSVLMYGETIHRFLYPAIKDVDIIMTEGTIYDWQTNTWVTQLHESIIIGEMEKAYHIKESATSCFDMEVAVYGIECTNDTNERVLLASDCILPSLINSDTNLPNPIDCTKYMFRQRVQEALYSARTIDDFGFEQSKQKEFKKNLADLFRNMRKYIRETGLSDDCFMKTLCDDISILYNSMGTNNGLMFAMSRQGSQGRQAAYTPGRIPRHNARVITPPSSPFTRTNSIPLSSPNRSNIGTSILSRTNTSNLEISVPDTLDFAYEEADDDNWEGSDDESTIITGFIPEDEINRYMMDYTNTSCYTTPGVMDTIRTMSQIRSNDEEL